MASNLISIDLHAINPNYFVSWEKEKKIRNIIHNKWSKGRSGYSDLDENDLGEIILEILKSVHHQDIHLSIAEHKDCDVAMILLGIAMESGKEIDKNHFFEKIKLMALEYYKPLMEYLIDEEWSHANESNIEEDI